MNLGAPRRAARRAARRACRARPSTASAPRACRRSGWRSTRSGRARATSYVAAGVESISQVDGYPKDAEELHPKLVRRRRADRERLHPDGADGRERRRALRRLARRHGPLRAALAGARRRGAGVGLLRPRDHAVHEGGRHGRLRATTARARARRSRSSQELEPAFKPGRQGHRRQLVPAERRRGRGRRHERASARASSASSRARGSSRRPCRASTRRSWASARSTRSSVVLGQRRDDDRRRRRDGAERGVRRAGDPRLPRARRRPVRREAEPARRRDRARPSVRHDRRADHVHAPQRPRRRSTARSGSRRCASAAARAWRWSSDAC